MAVNSEMDVEVEITEESHPQLMNAVAAALSVGVPVAGSEDRIHRQPEFWSARRDSAAGAYRVVIVTSYSAGPSEGRMTLSCWVHDDESPAFGPGSGVLRVSDMREDPQLEFT